MDAYVAETESIRREVQDLAADCGLDDCRMRIGAGGNAPARSVFLTVTGTLAEMGDDAEVVPATEIAESINHAPISA
jgi:S-adenosylmethionine synthetase